jgi:hypothetical protein
LDSDIAQLKPKADKADISIKNAAMIETWLAEDPNWLDEIAALSTKSPLKEFMLTRFNTPKATQAGTSNMQVQAVVKTTDVGDRFTSAMRDERHDPRPKTSDDENKVAGYPVSIETEIHISPPKPGAAKKDTTAAPAAAKPPAATTTDTATTTSPEAPAK